MVLLVVKCEGDLKQRPTTEKSLLAGAQAMCLTPTSTAVEGCMEIQQHVYPLIIQ